MIDIDLIKRAQEGDEESLTKVIRGSRRLVRFLVKKYVRYVRGFDFDDLEQEGYIGVWRALKDFDPSKSSFENYAAWRIRSRMYWRYKKIYRDNKREVSLIEDSYVFEEEVNPEIDVVLQRCLNSIDDRSRIVIQNRYGINCTPRLQRELGQELGISTQRISKIEEKAFEKMRKLINGEK